MPKNRRGEAPVWEATRFAGAAVAIFGIGEPGIITRTGMKCGLLLAHASACCLVSKKRSITTAFRSVGVVPDKRAAFRFFTAVPVSTAESRVPSGKMILLP